MKPLLFFACFLLVQSAHAQLKSSLQTPCAVFDVDLLDGRINGIDPKYTPAQIKKVLPCFTSEEREDTSSKCGGLVAYKTQDVYFYTGRNYVEIRDKFKGKLSIPLMGAARNSAAIFKWLGNVKIKDATWDAYDTSYGLMILYYNKVNKVNKIIFSTETTETINLCQ